MKKKPTLVAVGALVVLMLTAIPSAARAGENEAHCKSGNAVCSGTVTGGTVEIKNDAGEGMRCTAAEGSASLTSTTSTGSVELSFTGCREQVTIFKFTCSNTATAGKITTNTMVTHIVNLEHGGTTPGIMITGASVTYNCAGFAKKTVTGNLIGHIETPNCNTYQSTHAFNFTESSAGEQTYKQITTTGTAFTLESNNHPEGGGTYTTTSWTGTGTIHWTSDEVNITC